jgi:hypothetical protein
MKHNLRSATLAILSFAVFLASLAPETHAATCSTATVAGHWGFTLTGTLLLPTGPVLGAATGRVNADADGNVSGTEARSVGGSYANETGIGKWTVNPDCTGTLHIKFYESGKLVRTSVTTIVFDNNATEFRMVQKSLTLPDGTKVPVVVTVDGEKQ